MKNVADTSLSAPALIQKGFVKFKYFNKKISGRCTVPATSPTPPYRHNRHE